MDDENSALACFTAADVAKKQRITGTFAFLRLLGFGFNSTTLVKDALYCFPFMHLFETVNWVVIVLLVVVFGFIKIYQNSTLEFAFIITRSIF